MSHTTHAELRSLLDTYDQAHLLDFWDRLAAEQQTALATQIRQVDFELLRSLIQGADEQTDWQDLATRAVTPPAIRLQGPNSISADVARAAGEAAWRAGEIAVVVVAGGQGSRLGFPHPKGMFPLGPVSGRTLFQIHADRIRAAERRYGQAIPWYVMTSPATHTETVDYFAEHGQLGLDHVRVFCQGTMPAVDAETGRILLAQQGVLFESPDGHGGTLAALDRSGCLDDMQARGIKRLFYFQVDNPLVDIADATFIGYHLSSGSEMTSQVVAKQDPSEKVGVVVAVDGALRIIEYSDLPAEQAARRTPDGTLALWAGSIAVHALDVAFLQRVKSLAEALPFHRARKVVPYVDPAGRTVEPASPNALKFERFIFDLLPLAKRGLVVEVDAAEAFAPLKNARGAAQDTADTAQAAMIAQHLRWLRAAGAEVAPGLRVEINPLFAADGEELRGKLPPHVGVTADSYFNVAD